MKTIFAVVIIVILEFSIFNFQFSKKVFADTSCQPIYGGGETCFTNGGLLLDLTVMNPQTNKMVDSLKSTNPTYKPGFLVTFQLKLTNVTPSTTFPEIEVKDTFPAYVNYLAGEGNFDQNTRILSFNLKDLKPNQSKTYTLIGRIVDIQQLPKENSINCVVNQATGIVLDPASARDTATFCIERKQPLSAPTPTLPLKTGFPILPPSAKISITPATGNEILFTFALIPIGILGEFLRRKSKQLPPL